MRRFKIGCVFVCLALGLGGLSGGCFSLPECYKDFGTYLNNPNGLPCDKQCICNTQLYEGVCAEGVCKSRKRDTCQVTGDFKGCALLQKAGDSTCLSGKQVCNPQVFQDLQWPSLWGDCQPLDSSAGDENTRERCLDRLDNDCDGKVDAEEDACKDFCSKNQTRPCYDGPDGTINIGVCARGVQVCDPVTNKWRSECLNQSKPGKEICDGLDNDCNGKVDENLGNCGCKKVGETQICFTGPVSTTGVGECSAGQRTCEDQNGTLRWGECKGQKLPAKEECNGKDDNCDGIIDEDCPCSGQNTARACGKDVGECQAGTQFCLGGKWSALCPPQVLPQKELCNGKDDDCDGVIDEQTQGSDPLTRTCQTACGDGQETCQDGQWTGCTAPAPQPEVCNNKDDDCDGDIDEFLVQSCQSDCGKEGLEICSKGKWDLCTASKAETEVCDGKDNDCDGKIDNVKGSDTPLTLKCAVQSPCGEGTQTCTNGVYGQCNSRVASPEICDGKDNDCDGQTDEGTAPCVFTVVGQPKQAGYAPGKAKTEALLNRPYGMHISPNADGIYLLDSGNHRIRLIKYGQSKVFDDVIPIAGDGQPGYLDGPGPKALFNEPRDMVLGPSGITYYIADTKNHAIRTMKFDNGGPQIAHFAGSRTAMSGDKSNSLNDSLFFNPISVYIDVTQDPSLLYFSDRDNHKLKAINLSDNKFTNSLGAGKGFQNGDLSQVKMDTPGQVVIAGPLGIPVIYFLDTANHCLRMVSQDTNNKVVTLAGTCTQSGDKDGLGELALFNKPEGMVIDAAGNLYIADTGNHLIRKVSIYKTGNVAGARKFYARVSTVAGVSGKPEHKDGLPLKSHFHSPVRVFIDPYDGSLYVSDRDNHVIRHITLK